MKAIVGIFDNVKSVETVLTLLQSRGCPNEELSIVTQITDPTFLEQIEANPTDNTLLGAASGGLLGGVVGLLGSAMLIPIPGIGWALGYGAMSTAIGTVMGSYFGALGANRATVQAGNEIKESLAEGETAVIVLSQTLSTDEIKTILQEHNAEDVLELPVDL